MQKILIHEKRDRDRRAKDILYIHDTIETFGGNLAAIREQWQTTVRPAVHAKATRVVERYCRPTLVISRDGDEAHGSGRSIRAFHLLNALESCAGLFTRFTVLSSILETRTERERKVPEIASYRYQF